jgi:mono/diheme cytochrome c family protein
VSRARASILLATVVICVLAPGRVGAQGGAAAGNAANGRTVFIKAGCPACHGTMGQGGPGGRLAPKPVPAAAFTSYVRKGKVSDARANRNWAGMPPFSTKFISDSELADIYAYLANIAEPPAVNRIPLLAGP